MRDLGKHVFGIIFRKTGFHHFFGKDKYIEFLVWTRKQDARLCFFFASRLLSLSWTRMLFTSMASCSSGWCRWAWQAKRRPQGMAKPSDSLPVMMETTKSTRKIPTKAPLNPSMLLARIRPCELSDGTGVQYIETSLYKNVYGFRICRSQLYISTVWLDKPKKFLGGYNKIVFKKIWLCTYSVSKQSISRI